MFSTLRLEPRGTTLVVRFDNPPTDLLTGQGLTELDALGRCLARDRRFRAVVLTGPRVGVFIPHFDLAEVLVGAEELGRAAPYPVARLGIEAVAALLRIPGAESALASTPVAGLVTILATHRALSRFARLPQVVIAAIGGDALGGGCEVALAADLRLMADGPYLIGLPEISAGIPPGAGGSVRLASLIGPSRAVEMMLRAHPLSPHRAKEIGLVDGVEAAEDLLPRALLLAERVAAWNPAAVRSLKRAVAATSTVSGKALRVEAAGFVAAASGSAALDRLHEFGDQTAAWAGSSPWRNRSWLELDD